MTMAIGNAASAALLLLLLVLVVLAAYVLHKTRKIHLATYTLLKDASRSRRELDVLFAQIQSLLALERKLGLSDALPPLRGWAASPDFLLVLADDVLSFGPRSVVECGSGVSTLVISRCLQRNGSGHLYSLEHDGYYASKTRELLENYGLGDWATVLDAPLQTRRTATPWYDEDALPKDLAPIEMLIVDGPPAAIAPLARYPALPRLLPKMALHARVYLDDADREDEREVVRRWEQEFPEWHTAGDYRCEKGLRILHRKVGDSVTGIPGAP